MNDDFRDMKARTRHLDGVLLGGGLSSAEFTQALDRLRRALRRGDRTRAPSAELRSMLERAELLARSIG